MTLIEKIHLQRQLIDGLAQKAEVLKPVMVNMGGHTRASSTMELVSAITRIRLAKLWYGWLLGYINEPVNQMQDIGSPLNWLNTESHSDRVSNMIEEVDRYIKACSLLRKQHFATATSGEFGYEEGRCFDNIFTYLVEARAYLDQEVIRDLKAG